MFNLFMFILNITAAAFCLYYAIDNNGETRAVDIIEAAGLTINGVANLLKTTHAANAPTFAAMVAVAFAIIIIGGIIALADSQD